LVRRLRERGRELTPSELRVARLAAEGHSNRQIAGELYVTLKAIEGHLAHVYAKLGIEGRGQLAHALAAEKTRVPTLQRTTHRSRHGRAITSPAEGDSDGDDRT
jgi:DNA-binding CsgD family transcriptional regulator